MTWVRYDDEFHHHEKVMQARDADPGSLALHLLGNTWTASSKTPGWVPAYVPRQLVGAKAKKWAQILVDARLWDVAELDGKPGWWVHDFETYNPVDEATKQRRSDSARKAAMARWHPEDDLSDANLTSDSHPEASALAEHVAAGIDAVPASPSAVNTGNRYAPPHAARNARRIADAMPAASGSDAEDMPSDAIARGHPVPVPTNSTTSNGSPTAPAGFAPRIVRAYVQAARDAGVPSPEESQSRVERSARSLLAQGYDADAIEDAARNAAAGGWTDLATQLQRDASRASPATNGHASTTDQRVQAALDLAANLDRKAIG